MNWLKGTSVSLCSLNTPCLHRISAADHLYSLSAVAGTQEPIYGPEAIQPVSQQQTEDQPYTELSKNDLRWRAYQYTSVETQTFYMMADNGTLAMVQIIYSNIA